MLMFLSSADGQFPPEEGAVVVKYLYESFPVKINIDQELEWLSSLPRDEHYNCFLKAMDEFYRDSTRKERTRFLDTAVKMVMADCKLTPDENIYLRELFNAWEHAQETDD